MTDNTADLMARMLTCAAHLTTIEVSEVLRDDQMEAIIDARSLLVQAATELQKLVPGWPPAPAPEPPSEPMEILKPLQPQTQQLQEGKPIVMVNYDPGPPAEPPPRRSGSRMCPKCGSHTAKGVERDPHGGIVLTCPACSYRWLWKAPAGEWR